MNEEIDIQGHLYETRLHLKGAQAELILALRALLDLLIEATETWSAQRGTAPKNQVLYTLRALLDLALGRLDARSEAPRSGDPASEALCAFRTLVEESLAELMEQSSSVKSRAQIEAFETILAMLDQEIELSRSRPCRHGEKSAGIRKVVIE